MTTVSLSEARSELVRTRVMEGVAELLERGEELTFASAAKAAGVPERTFYRHFPTREALLGAVFDWANARIGFSGQLPSEGRELSALIRQVFPGFDAIAPVVRELLVAPEGRLARLARKGERQRASVELVRHELPDLDRSSARRLAAILQLLSAAATWQTLREYWDMDGAEAAEAAVLAVELLLDGARARQGKGQRNSKRRVRNTEKES